MRKLAVKICGLLAGTFSGGLLFAVVWMAFYYLYKFAVGFANPEITPTIIDLGPITAGLLGFLLGAIIGGVCGLTHGSRNTTSMVVSLVAFVAAAITLSDDVLLVSSFSLKVLFFASAAYHMMAGLGIGRLLAWICAPFTDPGARMSFSVTPYREVAINHFATQPEVAIRSLPAHEQVPAKPVAKPVVIIPPVLEETPEPVVFEPAIQPRMNYILTELPAGYRLMVDKLMPTMPGVVIVPPTPSSPEIRFITGVQDFTNSIA